MAANLAEEIVAILKKRGQKLAFAESCTGGLMADAIVSVSGASDVFLGSLVCYDASIKRNVLKVRDDIIEGGVVSEACALDMAIKARVLFGSDIALSSTGYAEPPADSDEEFCIYIALSAGGFTSVKKYYPKLSRNENRAAAVKCALEMLRDYISAIKG